MSNITKEITDALYEHVRREGGSNPDAVFLGYSEHTALKEVAAGFGIPSYISSPPTPVRLKFNGMAVYEVNAQSFICFGVLPPSPCS